jgi:hypothetical protein
MKLVGYDVESSIKAGELELPEVLIGVVGRSETERNGRLMEAFIEPAVELSPDGQRLAIVHADTDRITLVDAHSLTVEKTFSLGRPIGILNWFGFAPTPASQGTIRHGVFSADGQHLYVFSQEVWLESADAPVTRGTRGLWVVDLSQERVMADALLEYQIQWVQPAPDGTVYVFGTTYETLGPYEVRASSPSMLWRLDALTLEILAAREFTGYQGGRLIAAQPTR